MFAKLKAVLELFRKGEAVANAGVWKSREALTTAFVGLILAAVAGCKAFGVNIPEVNDTTALLWASGLASFCMFVSSILTTITNKDVGAKAKPDADADDRARRAAE